MTIGSLLGAGVSGVQKGIQEMNVTADKIVKVTALGADKEASFGGLAAEVINLNLYELQVEASVKVIKAADQNLGTLLDVTG